VDYEVNCIKARSSGCGCGCTGGAVTETNRRLQLPTVSRHNEGVNTAMADGHAKWERTQNILLPNTRWNP